jgi:hypothetical protein
MKGAKERDAYIFRKRRDRQMCTGRYPGPPATKFIYILTLGQTDLEPCISFLQSSEWRDNACATQKHSFLISCQVLSIAGGCIICFWPRSPTPPPAPAAPGNITPQQAQEGDGDPGQMPLRVHAEAAGIAGSQA